MSEPEDSSYDWESDDLDGLDIFTDDHELNEDRFSHAAMIVLDQARMEAIRTKWSQIRSPHIGMAIFAHPDSDVSIFARDNGVRAESIIKQFREKFIPDEMTNERPQDLTEPCFSENAIRCLHDAAIMAAARNADVVDERDMWRAILMDPSNFFVQVVVTSGVWPLWLLPPGW